MDDNGMVLAFGAHPDDVEFTCAGTLARLKQKGYRIAICTLCNGNCGSAEVGPEEIAAIRFKEGEAAAELLEAEYVCVGRGDGELVFDNATRRKVVAVMRRFDPFVVFAPPPMDYMWDHRIGSQLVMDATFTAGMPNFRSDPAAGASSGIPYLYYVDPAEGKDIFGQRWPASCFVDVTETFSTKREMLSRHDSQRSWLLKQHGIDHYIETMTHWTEARGRDAGVTYAEAFRQHLGHPYPQDNVLDTILGVVSP